MQNTCRIQAEYMQNTRRIHAEYMQNTSRIQAEYKQNTSRIQTEYKQNTSRIQAEYKQNTTTPGTTSHRGGGLNLATPCVKPPKRKTQNSNLASKLSFSNENAVCSGKRAARIAKNKTDRDGLSQRWSCSEMALLKGDVSQRMLLHLLDFSAETVVPQQ